MKKRIRISVWIAILLIGSLLCIPAVEATAVSVPDANLNAALCKSIGGQSLTAEALSTVTVLDLSGKSISNLTGLSYATALTNLSLSNNPIADISALSGCTALQTLELNNTGVRNLSALSALADLRVLHIENMPLESLAGIADLPKLQFVFCSSTDNTTIQEQIAALRKRGVYVVTYAPANVSLTAKSDTSLTIDPQQFLVSGVSVGTTAESLLNMLQCSVTISLVNANGDRITGIVGTGARLLLTSGGTQVGEYTVVVQGDLTGDGDISSTDMMLVKASILNKTTLNKQNSKAADYDFDGTVTVTDYMKLKFYILKK